MTGLTAICPVAAWAVSCVVTAKVEPLITVTDPFPEFATYAWFVEVSTTTEVNVEVPALVPTSVTELFAPFMIVVLLLPLLAT